MFSGSSLGENLNGSLPSSDGLGWSACVLGGGSYSSSGSTLVTVNSSLPSSGQSWMAHQDNALSGSTTFTPYAVCGPIS